MRVSYGMINNQILNGLMNSADQLAQAQAKATTGLRITTPSDDPAGTERAMGLNSTLSQIDQMTNNASIATGQLGQTDSALQSISTAISQLRQLAMQASDSTLSSDARAGIASQIDQITGELVTAGNSTFNGKYIFAGDKTSTAPIVANAGGTPPHSYGGDTGAYSIPIGPGTSITANITGDQVFNIGGAANSNTPDIFSTIQTLKQAVLAGNVGTVSDSLDSIDANFSNVTALRAEVGARVQRITATTSQLADTKLTVQNMLSQTVNVDLTQAVTDLQTKTNTYQAAIAAAQKVFSISLADYFR